MRAINLKSSKIPVGWVSCTLPDFTLLEMGQSPPSETYNHQKIGLPFFQGKAEFTSLYPDIDKYCSEPSKIANVGATLLSVRAPVGPTNLANIVCCIGRGLAAIHPLGGIEPKFILFLMRSIEKDISDKGTGSTFSAINKTFLEELVFALPPLSEQKRIIAKIEELFSELDKAIESLKTARAQLKAYRQAILKYAFANIQQKIALEKVSEAVGGYAFKSTSFKTDGGKYQVIRMGNVRPGTIREGESPVFLDDVDEKIVNRYLLKRGDVLITLTGTRTKRDYGFTAVVRNDHYLVNQRIAYLRFNQAYLPEFFLYFSWTEDFKRQFFGHETGIVGQGNVGMKAIRTTMVPDIEISEQKRIIQRLESNFTTIEALERTIEAELQKSEALRHSILKKAFSSKLVAQDPNDEPASVLLERIGAEKKFHPVTNNNQHEIKPVNKYVQNPLFQETAV